MNLFARIVCAIVAAPLPTLAVMFCAGRTDLMSAPVDVRFSCLVMAIVAALFVFAVTDRGERA